MNIQEALNLARDFKGEADASDRKRAAIISRYGLKRPPAKGASLARFNIDAEDHQQIRRLERSAARAKAKAKALWGAVDRALQEGARAIPFRNYELKIVAYRNQHLKVRAPNGVEFKVSRATGRSLPSAQIRSRGRGDEGAVMRSFLRFFDSQGAGRPIVHQATLHGLVDAIDNTAINIPEGVDWRAK